MFTLFERNLQFDRMTMLYRYAFLKTAIIIVVDVIAFLFIQSFIHSLIHFIWRYNANTFKYLFFLVEQVHHSTIKRMKHTQSQFEC